MNQKRILLILPFFLCAIATGYGYQADYPQQPKDVSNTETPLALEGYDVTTYFDEGGPVKVEEDNAVTMEWNGKKWRFLSDENKKQFAKQPIRYAPRFNGRCCQSLAEGEVREGDPQIYHIVDGRLYLFHNKEQKQLWTKGLPESKVRSEDNYAKLFSYEAPDQREEEMDTETSLAIQGYDVTTYFDDGGPVKVEEDSAVTMEWNGKEWWFLSVENKKQFAKDPYRYAPRFKGSCCQSLAQGELRKGDPRVFRIVDGRLYLFHNKDQKQMWLQDLPVSKSRSEDHFIKLFSREF